MSPDLFRAMQKRAGLKGYELASRLGVSDETVSRWRTGKSPIPKVVGIAMSVVAAPINGAENGNDR